MLEQPTYLRRSRAFPSLPTRCCTTLFSRFGVFVGSALSGVLLADLGLSCCLTVDTKNCGDETHKPHSVRETHFGEEVRNGADCARTERFGNGKESLVGKSFHSVIRLV